MTHKFGEVIRIGEPEQRVESTRWIVFQQDDARIRCEMHCVDWVTARQRGARKLGIKLEVTWAVTPLDGESDRDAVMRAVRGRTKR